MGAALLGGAGSVLFAGSAQAATGCGVRIEFEAWASGTALTCDDKQFTYDSSSGLPAGGNLVSASVDPTGTYLFLYDFANPDFNNISNFTLGYIASIVGTSDFFTVVDVDSLVPTTSPSEELTATWRTGSFTGPIVATLQSINGSPTLTPVAGEPTTLYVSNVYFTPEGGSISEFQNSFRQGTQGTTVPGPLPLLGAGMAFGFSRKLRSRIKARVQA